MNVILLTGQAPSNQFMGRYAGPHRLATELRNNNISTKVINGLGYFDVNEFIAMCETFVSDQTLVLGISTTFFYEYTIRHALFPSKLYSGDNFKKDILTITHHFKRKFPKIKIVVGGPTARMNIEDTSVIDLFIEGYADELLVSYVNSLRGLSKKLFFNNFHNNVPLISNPMNENFNFRNSNITFEEEDAILPGETLPLELARGCVFKCKFCAYPLRGKTKDDVNFLKDENNVYDELMTNYEKFRTTNYIFVDDTFNDSITKLESLHKVFDRLPFKINFAAYIRPDLLNAYPESIDMLFDMGIRGAFFGIETLNDDARKTILKGFSSEKLLRILEQVNSKWKNVSITSSFIYGLPGDTPESIRDWTDNIIYGSDIFNKHDLIFQALYILGKSATYKSDFDEDMEKYNYKIVPGKKSWVNDVTDFTEMFAMAKEANLKTKNVPRPFSSFHSVTLLGYGLPIEKILSLDSHNPVDIDFVEKLTISQYNHYADLVKKK